MTNYATTGFLTNGGRTIKFTIVLDKPIVNAEVEFSTMNLQVRQYNNEMLINDDVMQSDYSVITEVQSIGILVTITQSEIFSEIIDMPLSVYIIEAHGVFI